MQKHEFSSIKMLTINFINNFLQTLCYKLAKIKSVWKYEFTSVLIDCWCFLIKMIAQNSCGSKNQELRMKTINSIFLHYFNAIVCAWFFVEKIDTRWVYDSIHLLFWWHDVMVLVILSSLFILFYLSFHFHVGWRINSNLDAGSLAWSLSLSLGIEKERAKALFCACTV